MSGAHIEGFLPGVKLQFSPPADLSRNHPGPVLDDLGVTGGTVLAVFGHPSLVKKHSHSLPFDEDISP